MIKINELITAINRIAPEELAESWDNCGMQIHTGRKEAERILICLEITKEVIAEAKRRKADFIITHHPIYFTPITSIDNNTIIGNYTIELIKAGISVYSSHTCFDKVSGGNNTYLCDLLDLKDTKPLIINESTQDYMGYTGEFPGEISLIDAAKLIKEKLKLSDGELRITGNPERTIKLVGVCTGAGADIIEAAADKGCDLCITGDVKYHQARIAMESGICLIDAGHFSTEDTFRGNMAEKLKNEIGTLAEILISEVNLNPFTFI